MNRSRFLLPLAASTALCAGLGRAQDLRSASADNLNLAGAWVDGTVPGGSDVATWDAASALANTLDANLGWGGLNLAAAAGPVSIAGNNTLLLDHATDANTVLDLGSNSMSWGTDGIGGAFHVNGAAGSTSSTATGATFTGSGTLTLGSTGTKNWSSNGTTNGVTNLGFTGTLRLRGVLLSGTGSVPIENLANNWFALGGGGGNLSGTPGAVTQSGAFHLDTGDAASRGELILTHGFNEKTLNLLSLAGTGNIRSDWGIGAPVSNRAILVNQATDTVFAGGIYVHNGSGQRRNVTLTKDGPGTLVFIGRLGSSQATGGNPAFLNFAIQGGVWQMGDGSENPSPHLNAANWDGNSTVTVGSAGTLRFRTNESEYNWDRKITGGDGTIEVAGDGTPGKGKVAFTADNSGFAGQTKVLGGQLRVGGSLANSAVSVASGAAIAAGTPAANGTGTTGSLALANGSSSSFRLALAAKDKLVTGALSATGSHTVNVSGSGIGSGSYPLLDYSGTLGGDGFAAFALGTTPTLARPATFELVDNAANTSIDLKVTTETPVWSGALDSNWDTFTGNWGITGNPSTAYIDGEGVVFDDSALNTNVTLVGTIAPGAVSLRNATKPYTFTGTALGGAATVSKDGAADVTFAIDLAHSGGTTVRAGTLTLTGASNTSTGGITVAGGKLQVGTGGPTGDLGGGPVHVAAGATLEINRSHDAAGSDPDLDYKANAKLRTVSGAGDIVLTGGAILFNYTGSNAVGGGVSFDDPDAWTNFSGRLIVKGGSEFRTIRNGATAMGSGEVILGDATGSGSLAQIEGNWTWTNSLALTGSANKIVNRSAGAPRSLKLQGAISGAGGLTFEDAAGSMSDPNRGFILTAANTLTGTITIPAGVPVRVGGVPGNVSVNPPGLNADAAGTLGAATVANDGTLTFSRTDSHTVANPIGGGGAVRVGIPAIAGLGDTTSQVVNYTGNGTWTGDTTVHNGTLVIAAGGSVGASVTHVQDGATLAIDGAHGAPLLALNVQPGGTLKGSGTTQSDVYVTGTIAPGGGTGTFSCAGRVTFDPSSVYRWEIANWEGTSAGTDWDLVAADELDVLALDGNDLKIVIGGAAVGFSETAKTFRIATAASFLTGFDPAAVTVDAAAFAAATGAAGTWAVQENPATRSLELVYTPGTPSGYSAWAIAKGLDGTPGKEKGASDDPDRDGFANVVEFVLDRDPLSPAATNQPVLAAAGNSFVFSYTRRDDSAYLNPAAEYDADLAGTWTTAQDGVDGVTITVTDQGATDIVTVTIPKGGNPRLFARLRVP